MASLSGADKAAILLLSLGEEAAAQILRQLGPAEQRAVSERFAAIGTVPARDLLAVHKEFRDRLAEPALLLDGRDFARSVLQRVSQAGGKQVDEALLREIESPGQPGCDALARVLQDLPPETLFAVLRGEHPQVVAFLLAHLPPRVAADAVRQLPEDRQADILLRIARLGRVSPGTVEEVESVLSTEVGGVVSAGAQSAGGPRATAEIMNLLDKDTEGRIFGQMEGEEAELAEQVRQLMLTFEDLLQIDNRGMQTVLKEVPREDLLTAMKTASEALREKILSNLSSRAAEILKEDLAAMGPVRLREVEKAQANIITVVRQLNQEGKIILARGGDEDVIV